MDNDNEAGCENGECFLLEFDDFVGELNIGPGLRRQAQKVEKCW